MTIAPPDTNKMITESRSDAPGGHRPAPRLMLVGPGFHLLGGLSVYTCRLAHALAESFDVSVLLLHKVVPTRFYPGGARAGQALTSLDYGSIPVRAQFSWYGGAGLLRAAAAIWRERPSLLVLQWWTTATLHLYLVLAVVARLRGVKVALEFHEVQDTGEAAVPGVAAYARTLMPRLLRLVDGGIVHSEHDADLLARSYGDSALSRLALETAPHGPYDHLSTAAPVAQDHDADTARDQDAEAAGAETATTAETTGKPVRLLFFGLIRPYKGCEDLVLAFDALNRDEVDDFRLTVVGETWENWTRPVELIENSRYADKITLVNRYVSDAEAAGYFADADVVVLPYRRGSASGPLQIAMSNGLHVVMYDVEGLREAVRDYDGVRLVEQDSVAGLTEALRGLRGQQAVRFADPHSWQATRDGYSRLIERVRATGVESGPPRQR